MGLFNKKLPETKKNEKFKDTKKEELYEGELTEDELEMANGLTNPVEFEAMLRSKREKAEKEKENFMRR